MYARRNVWRVRTRQSGRRHGLVPTITGLLCGGIALLWLANTGHLQGYAISAVLAVYAIVGGAVALIGTISERVVTRFLN
jgi:hypothetical protein